MNITTWLRANLRGTLIVALILAIVLAIGHFTFKAQHDRYISEIGISTGKIEVFQANTERLEMEAKGYKAIGDSLKFRIQERDEIIKGWQGKYAKLDKKYTEKAQQIKELPEEAQVELFLDRADCGEFPILKYEENYIAPIEAIGFYNILANDFDQVSEANELQKGEILLYRSQLNNYGNLLVAKDNELSTQGQIIENQNKIDSERINQLATKDKQMKAEKRKVVTTKIIAGFAIVAETVVIVALLLK